MIHSQQEDEILQRFAENSEVSARRLSVTTGPSPSTSY